MSGLKGRTALVTDGGSGIGRSIAIRLAEEGVRVAINYVCSPEGANATREAIEAGLDSCMCAMRDAGTQPLLVRGDVSDDVEVERMFAEIADVFGPVDILINNAGIQVAAETELLSVHDFDRVLAVNLRGSFLCAQQTVRGLHPYLGPRVCRPGIRVNAIAPGATVTPINRAWIDDPEKRAMVVSHIPMGRAGTSEEMAAVTAFLCSDDAAYITGHTMFVDGGLTLFADFRATWSSE